MTIDWWTLGLQTVNVLVLVWILARFLFKPVAKIIAERQQAARAALDAAERARAEAEADRKAAQAERERIARTRAELLGQAQAAAEAEKRRLLAEAQEAADKARAETREALARMHDESARALTDEAGALAADIATRLLGRLPDSARIAGFIDGLAQAVTELPATTRDGIGTGGPVPLRAPRALTGDERARLEARLAEALGRKVMLAVEADPALIAGLELDAPHAIVRNHFRADLDRIKAEVLAHDRP